MYTIGAPNLGGMGLEHDAAQANHTFDYMVTGIFRCTFKVRTGAADDFERAPEDPGLHHMLLMSSNAFHVADWLFLEALHVVSSYARHTNCQLNPVSLPSLSSATAENNPKKFLPANRKQPTDVFAPSDPLRIASPSTEQRRAQSHALQESGDFLDGEQLYPPQASARCVRVHLGLHPSFTQASPQKLHFPVPLAGELPPSKCPIMSLSCSNPPTTRSRAFSRRRGVLARGFGSSASVKIHACSFCKTSILVGFALSSAFAERSLRRRSLDIAPRVLVASAAPHACHLETRVPDRLPPTNISTETDSEEKDADHGRIESPTPEGTLASRVESELGEGESYHEAGRD
ncbi:hypothetical protein DFH06DRAFT_1127862 [Mycena polygramma]|nr:hypothetical protein DFH06DRAFT_1127862 [Mycena polygramma]